MILRTDAVVLRSFRYGETSLIVTLFTRDRGKVSVLAKGARTTKSRFGATLLPLSHIQALLSYKPTRTLQTLRESSHLTLYNTLRDDLDKTSAGLRMLELVDALLQEEEGNPLIFDLLASALAGLDAAPGRAINALAFFELRLSGLLGFAPQFERDDLDALGDDGGALLLDSGGIVPTLFSGGAARRAARTTLRAFAIAARADLDAVLRMKLDDDTAEALASLVESYLQYHTEDAYPTRSQRVRGQLGDASTFSSPPA